MDEKFGDCINCKYVCLKYMIQDCGVVWFKGEVEKCLGVIFELVWEFYFIIIEDFFGW